MRRITIELEPPERGSTTEGRLFAFPDGVERLIVLPRRSWSAYDTLDAAWGFSGDYEQASLQWTLEKLPPAAPGFEEELRRLFALCIQMGWVVYNEDRRGSTNENR